MKTKRLIPTRRRATATTTTNRPLRRIIRRERKQSPRRRTIARTPVEVVELLKIVGLAFTTRGGIDPRRRTTPRRRRRRQRVAVKPRPAPSARRRAAAAGIRKQPRRPRTRITRFGMKRRAVPRRARRARLRKRRRLAGPPRPPRPGPCRRGGANAPPRASPSVVRSPVQPPGPPSDNTS